MTWHEVRLQKGVEPTRFYTGIEQGTILSFHHFWDEPWWPDGYVVRIEGDDLPAGDLAQLPDVDHVVPWDAGPDEELFGETWPYVRHLFWASSAISNSNDSRFTLKLVHCLLNARGMSEWDEAKFAARLFWNRLTIRLKLKLKGAA